MMPIADDLIRSRAGAWRRSMRRPTVAHPQRRPRSSSSASALPWSDRQLRAQLVDRPQRSRGRSTVSRVRWTGSPTATRRPRSRRPTPRTRSAPWRAPSSCSATTRSSASGLPPARPRRNRVREQRGETIAATITRFENRSIRRSPRCAAPRQRLEGAASTAQRRRRCGLRRGAHRRGARRRRVGNVTSAAASIEELAGSIGEIAAQAAKSTEVASRAVEGSAAHRAHHVGISATRPPASAR